VEKLGPSPAVPELRREVLPICHFVLWVQCLLPFNPPCSPCVIVGICPCSPSPGYSLSIIPIMLNSWCGVHLNPGSNVAYNGLHTRNEFL
jgi:hypothetical protein